MGKNALIAIIALQAVFANLFALKQTALFGFSVTCSDAFVIGSILALNLLQEYYGKESAQKAVRVSFLSLLFFAVMSQIHLLYEPSPIDRMHGSFAAILSMSPRIVAASVATFYLVQKADVLFFGWLKSSFSQWPLPVRIGLSLMLSQLLDTVLFSFLGLYGIVESIVDVIALSYLIKCLMIACSSPLTALAKRFLKEPVS
jgi:uncharacterized integral membrane protein (TIGR00697 family)